MSMIMTSKATFAEEVLGNKLPVIAIFSAPWCGYCKRLRPALQQLAEEMAGKAVFAGVNIDEENALAEEYKIETIPSLILFKGGEASELLVNPPSKAFIKDWLQTKGVE